jgi:hypothetical protein
MYSTLHQYFFIYLPPRRSPSSSPLFNALDWFLVIIKVTHTVYNRPRLNLKTGRLLSDTRAKSTTERGGGARLRARLRASPRARRRTTLLEFLQVGRLNYIEPSLVIPFFRTAPLHQRPHPHAMPRLPRAGTVVLGPTDKNLLPTTGRPPGVVPVGAPFR